MCGQLYVLLDTLFTVISIHQCQLNQCQLIYCQSDPRAIWMKTQMLPHRKILSATKRQCLYRSTDVRPCVAEAELFREIYGCWRIYPSRCQRHWRCRVNCFCLSWRIWNQQHHFTGLKIWVKINRNANIFLFSPLGGKWLIRGYNFMICPTRSMRWLLEAHNCGWFSIKGPRELAHQRPLSKHHNRVCCLGRFTIEQQCRRSVLWWQFCCVEPWLWW